MPADQTKLMHYIAGSPEWYSSLKIWADNSCHVLTPAFFFWRAGTREQKSLNGLLRSLLYHLLSEHIPFLSLLPPSRLASSHWPEQELRHYIMALVTQAENQKVKICFLIDGLDEFEGDADSEIQLASMIQNLVQYPNIKAIVSSRPEEFLERHFLDYPALRLQDLNEQDIRKYVTTRITNSRWVEYYQGISFENLCDTIIMRAEGVFLWARLAVHDLIRGLQARHPMSELKSRLEQLHKTLEGLFKQMLDRVDPVYRPSAANYLRFTQAWYQSSAPRWCFIELEAGGLTLLDMANGCSQLAMPSGQLLSNEPNLTHWSHQSLDNLLVSIEVQSAGLLEVSSFSRDLKHWPSGHCSSEPSDTTSACPFSPSRTSQILNHFAGRTSVKVIHRSVWDFIRTSAHASEFLEQATLSNDNLRMGFVRIFQGRAEAGFSMLLDAISSSRSCTHGQFVHQWGYENLWRNFLQPVDHLIVVNDLVPLEQIGKWFTRKIRQLQSTLRESELSPVDNERPWDEIRLSFLVAIPAKVVFFERLNNVWPFPETFSYALNNLTTEHRPFTRYIFDTILGWRNEREFNGLQFEVIESLLTLGLDPNLDSTAFPEFDRRLVLRRWPENTPWKRFLILMYSGRCDRQDRGAQESLMLANCFLDAGADVNTSILRVCTCIAHTGLVFEISVVCIIEAFCEFHEVDDRGIVARCLQEGATRLNVPVELSCSDAESEESRQRYKPASLIQTFTDPQRAQIMGELQKGRSVCSSRWTLNRDEEQAANHRERLGPVLREVWQDNQQWMQQGKQQSVLWPSWDPHPSQRQADREALAFDTAASDWALFASR